jgi:predicted GNAT family N-acyltransferase
MHFRKYECLTEELITLRSSIFIDEQGISLADEFDTQEGVCDHYGAFLHGELIGYGRLMFTYDTVNIDRIALKYDLRKKGLGKEFLIFLENEAMKRGCTTAKLHAQQQSSPFYEKQGYNRRGEHFIEAGIVHVEMYKSLEKEGRYH